MVAGAMLALTIILMGIGSLIVALTPPASAIGIGAPLLLLVARLIQGFSDRRRVPGLLGVPDRARAGRRSAPSPDRGRWSASASRSCSRPRPPRSTTALIPQPALGAWGWRIPFLIGAVLALYGVWLRTRLPETPAFATIERRREINRQPLTDALRQHPRAMLYVFVCRSERCSSISGRCSCPATRISRRAAGRAGLPRRHDRARGLLRRGPALRRALRPHRPQAAALRRARRLPAVFLAAACPAARGRISASSCSSTSSASCSSR